MSIDDLRAAYMRTGIDPATSGDDPLALFQTWLREATEAGVPMPIAMTLATVKPDGSPAARAVILRGLDDRGLVFYTNSASRKGEELAAEPRAALLFTWTQVERQVRIEGVAERVAQEETAAFYNSRPLDVRLQEWASQQSRPVKGRATLEESMASVRARYKDEPPVPPHFAGYRVVPHGYEFWQGRDDRLHDRLLYTRFGEAWTVQRLQP